MYAPVGPISPPSSRPGSLHRCVVERLQGAPVRPPFLRDMESLREEASYQLFGNGGELPYLLSVPEFNLTPLGLLRCNSTTIVAYLI